MSARTIRISTALPADADRVWSAMQHAASFLYVCRGLLGWPALSGRTDPVKEGESGAGMLLLAHMIPLHKHHIHVLRVDHDSRTIETREHGGLLTRWDHSLQVRPVGEGRSLYTDTITLEAGRFTPVAAILSTGIYRYRQMRWRRLARKHLQPDQPKMAAAAPHH